MIRLVAVLPDPDEARDWAERELERAAYREAEPTLFDRVAQAIGQFFIDLFNPQLGARRGAPSGRQSSWPSSWPSSSWRS